MSGAMQSLHMERCPAPRDQPLVTMVGTGWKELYCASCEATIHVIRNDHPDAERVAAVLAAMAPALRRCARDVRANDESDYVSIPDILDDFAVE